MTTWLDNQEADRVEAQIDQMRQHRPALIQAQRGDERFALWLHLVDRRVRRQTLVGAGDLVDWPSRESYESGDSPSQAAKLAIENDEWAPLIE